EFTMAEDSVVDIQYCTTGITEHMFDTLFREAAYDDFRAGDFFTDRVIACFRGHALTSFQGPLEIDRMLSPVETTTTASRSNVPLLCAYTDSSHACSHAANQRWTRLVRFKILEGYLRDLALVARVRANSFQNEAHFRQHCMMSNKPKTKRPPRWRRDHYVTALHPCGQVKSPGSGVKWTFGAKLRRKQGFFARMRHLNTTLSCIPSSYAPSLMPHGNRQRTV